MAALEIVEIGNMKASESFFILHDFHSENKNNHSSYKEDG